MSSTILTLANGSGIVAMSATDAAKRTRPELFGHISFMTPSRKNWIQARFLDVTTNNYLAYVALLADTYLARTAAGPQDGFNWAQNNNVPPPVANTWEVPGTYLDDGTNNPDSAGIITDIRYDAYAAYLHAFLYYMYGDEAHATAAIALITPWLDVANLLNASGDGTRLGWANNFPMFLHAYDMIKTSASCTSTFVTRLRALAVLSKDVPGSLGWENTNNQGCWGTYLNLTLAGFLQDRTMYDQAIARWKFLVNYSLDSNSVFWQEVYREHGGTGNGISGLHYIFHSLNALILGAEVARANGDYLYDYTSPPNNQNVVDKGGKPFLLTGNQNLEKAYRKMIVWLNNPNTYPYNSSGVAPIGEEVVEPSTNLGPIEIAENLWPTTDGQAKLIRNRPILDRRVPWMGVPFADSNMRL